MQPFLVKLINFMRWIVSLVRLSWKVLRLAWTHGGALRALNEQASALVADKQLALHFVSLGSEGLAMANANSVPVQRLIDHTRALMRTDLLPASLPLMTRSVEVATAERAELQALGAELADVLSTPLPGPTLRLATRALAVARQYPDDARAAVQALIAFLEAPTDSASGPQPPLEQSALQRLTQILTVATGLKPELGALTARLSPVIEPELAKVGIQVAQETARTVETQRTAVLDLGRSVGQLLTQPPCPEVFALAERSARLVWVHGDQLLSLMNSSPDLLRKLGKVNVATSYLLRGQVVPDDLVYAEEHGVLSETAEVPVPPISAAAAVGMAARAVDDVITRLDHVVDGIKTIEIPIGLRATERVPVAGHNIPVMWELDKRMLFEPVAAELDALTAPVDGQLGKLRAAARSLHGLNAQLFVEGRSLYEPGVDLIGVGLALEGRLDPGP